jgi:hypothetical protein
MEIEQEEAKAKTDLDEKVKKSTKKSVKTKIESNPELWSEEVRVLGGCGAVFGARNLRFLIILAEILEESGWRPGSRASAHPERGAADIRLWQRKHFRGGANVIF